MDARPTLDDMVRWFESLTRETTREVPRYYADDAYFRDPFNEVRSAAAIERIYAHMFDQVDVPRFRVTQRWHGDDGTVLGWDFTFRMRGSARAELVQGLTHLRFGTDGRIVFHRDHWDAAGELYERIPMLGMFMRMLKGRLRTP
jgi:ketosteroid isomerase-like protein